MSYLPYLSPVAHEISSQRRQICRRVLHGYFHPICRRIASECMMLISSGQCVSVCCVAVSLLWKHSVISTTFTFEPWKMDYMYFFSKKMILWHIKQSILVICVISNLPYSLRLQLIHFFNFWCYQITRQDMENSHFSK